MTTISYMFDQVSKDINVWDAGDTSKPMIILLHGTGGSISDMTTPAVSPQGNYDFTGPLSPNQNIGWKNYPGIGVWSFELDQFKTVKGWQPLLQENNFRTAVYNQVDKIGFLERPVQEFAVVLAALEQAYPGTKFVLLAHSRGGLLARKFLKDMPKLAGNIEKVITLHAPHTGSELANVASTIQNSIDGLENTFGSIITTALGWYTNMIYMDAYQELAAGGTFITELENGELPLPNIEYFTFGGTSVTYTRILAWVYTLGSALPQWHWPPFFHRITQIEILGVSPVLDSLPNIVPEITEGQGDILTADTRTRLPFAVHTTNDINHAEALWDSVLQIQVLSILGVDTSFWN